MFRTTEVHFQLRPALICLAAVTLIVLLPHSSQAQRVRDSSAPAEAVTGFNEFKGVHLGMTADECRKKLGSPANKSDDEDLYSFGDNLSAQVLYKTNKVVTISINFLKPSEAPSAREVVGSDIEAKPDGSMHKMVRYPKAGYWIAYSRTAGDSPMISVTLQKID